MKKLKTTAAALLLSVSLSAGVSAAGTGTTSATRGDGTLQPNTTNTTNTTYGTYGRGVDGTFGTYGTRDGVGTIDRYNMYGDRTVNRYGTMNTTGNGTYRANNYRATANNNVDWGWLGLLGLLGLTGLRGRNREDAR